ncbi:MAG: dicarboxylate/amino acid:cation symporter [Burkholderiaceae bacterium]|nr:dicarboxylate/amino acid:cation symporter [Burkholderiaceae bacterium]
MIKNDYHVYDNQPKPWYKVLYVQVLIAIALGILIGHFWPRFGISLEPLGKGFINLIKMVITPIIFCTIVAGIANMRDLKQMGRVGLKALIYFEVVSTLALIVGFITGHLIKPGIGINASVSSFAAKDVAKVSEFAAQSQGHGMVDFLMGLIPTTAFSPFVEGNILQVLLIAIMFGVVLTRVPEERARPLIHFIEGTSDVFFGMVGIITKLAPIGAFGAMAFTIGKFGISSLANLLGLIGTFYLTALLFVVIVLGIIAKLTGFSIFKFIKYIKEELLLVLGTSSSESALPHLMEKLERMGCKKSVVGLVVPTGYSFNLDGTNIYMTLAVLFIAQALNIDLTLWQQLTILGVAMLTSKGASGVTGAGFVTLAGTLMVVPDIPVAGMALILGIDRFMSEVRALTNFVGNGVATVVVSKWENSLDENQMHEALK